MKRNEQLKLLSYQITVHYFALVLFCWLNSEGMCLCGCVDRARRSATRGGALMKKKSHAIKTVTPEKLQAVTMSLEGKSSEEIGRAIGRDGSTIRRWLREPEVIEQYRLALQAQAIPIVATAVRNLKNDLDIVPTNGHERQIRQNASFYALNRYEAPVLGENEGACTITFLNGTIDVGMPDGNDEDDE